MDFPHMGDNQFPYIDNVDPYKFVNDFDYSRWEYSSINVKLMNVLWDNSLTNVPYFANDNVRNQYFNEKTGHTVQLNSGFVVVPEETIRVPLPYNVAYTYNYVRIGGIAGGTTAALDYGAGYGNTNWWYYFIVDMRQLSPSTTELYLQLDYWTTFINSVNIPYMVLERGHAPMALVDVDTYLADPINNNEYLLAKDFDFGNDSTVVKSSAYMPVGNGRKWVLFAMPIDSNDFANFYASATPGGSSTPPTYSDEIYVEEGETKVTRWGDDLIVNDYAWNFGNAQAYGNANLPVKPYNRNGNNVLNGYSVFAILATDADAFFSFVANNAAYMMNAIEAVLIVGEDCLSLGATITWNNFTIRKAQPFSQNITMTFNKQSFAYDAKYADIAKLYTYPYAHVEITDNYGNTAEVRIENVSSTLTLHKETEIAFPYIQYRCFFTGINGSRSAIYTWQELNGQGNSKTMWEDDFSKFMFTWDIPTFALRVSAATKYVIDNHSSINAKRQAAIYEYQTADRYANTTKANTYDSQNAMMNNIKNSATTDKENTNRLSDTSIANMTRENLMNDRLNGDDTSRVPAGWVAVGGINPSLQQTTWAAQELAAQNSMANAANKAYQTKEATRTLIEAGVEKTDASLIASSASTAIQSGFSVAGAGHIAVNAGNAALAAGTTGALIGGGAGAIIGAAVGAVGSIVGSTITNATGYAQTRTYADAQETYNDSLYDIDYTGAGGLWDGYVKKEFKIKFDESKSIIQNTNTAQIAATNEAIDCNKETTENLHLTTGNPDGTIPYNALQTETTAHNNAQRTYDTETINAGWTRDANWQAANANLILRQMQAEAAFNDGRLRKPDFVTNYGGNAYPDVWENRGIQWKIRTQSKSAIAQAGDGMLRYGYTVHRVWDIEDKDFCKMEKFTFWKAEDIWITNNDKTADKVSDVLMRAFLDGVTVWTNPDEIGSVSIYNNPVREEVQL